MARYAHARALEKKSVLCSSVRASLAACSQQIRNDDLDRLAEMLVDSLCQITPPEEPELLIHYITLDMGGRTGGTSTKPGNVVLNFGKFVVAFSSTATAVAGMLSSPYLAPLSAIVLWNALYAKAVVDLTERESSVIWTMWLNRDDENKIAKEGLLTLVNDERKHYERIGISHTELDDALDRLKKIAAIEDDAERWWLREWVQVKYR